MPLRIKGSFRRTRLQAAAQIAREVLTEANASLQSGLQRVKQGTQRTGLVPKWLYGRTAESQPTQTVQQSWRTESFSRGRASLVQAVGNASLAAQLTELQEDVAARVYNDSMAFQPGNAFSNQFFTNRVITSAFRSSGALGREAIRFYGC